MTVLEQDTCLIRQRIIFKALTQDEYQAQVVISNERKSPISLYCHIPFCDTVCFYCGCNKVVTKDKTKAEPYLERLFKEIDQQGALFNHSRKVEQMHFGGGTPTFLSNAQIIRLSEKLQSVFNFVDDGEYSIEVDPRGVDEGTIKTLARARFNRIQSFEQTKSVMDLSRVYRFKSISIDLIYRLPK